MPYGWHNEANLLHSHHWVNYGHFVRLLQRYKFMSFSVKAKRTELLTALENMPSDPPFSIDTRFPDDAIYIDMDHSVPSKILMQLSMALDYADRQSEKGRGQPDNIETRAYSNFEDAKTAFYNSLRSLLDLVGPLPIESAHIFGIYVRVNFESEHSLQWT